jgi:hypothetical protein
MDVVIIFILVFFTLGVWRYLNHEYAAVKFRVRLRNLQTDLRLLIDKGKVNKNDKLALFLTESIDKISDSHYTITMFSIWMQSRKVCKDQKSEEVRARFRQDLDKNAELKLINRRLSYILLFYLREQHYFSVMLFVSPAFFFFVGLLKYRRAFINYIQSFPVSQGDLPHGKIYHV